MTKEEYVEGKIKAGHQIHEHMGVHWETTKFGYCKPAVKYEGFDIGQAKPSLFKSMVGFNHRINSTKHATGFWYPFILDQEGISNWDLSTLKSGNRKRRIKKGIKNNKVEKVDDISQYKEDFSRILKSTAERNGHGFPPDYYDLDKTEWWRTIEQVAHYTEFWCSFHEGKMSAYICLHVMGERVVYDGVKSDTEMLPTCPIDAINHAILNDLRDRGNISEIWYGGKSTRKTLDDFKESYGFKVVEVPYAISFIGGLLKYPKFLQRTVLEK